MLAQLRLRQSRRVAIGWQDQTDLPTISLQYPWDLQHRITQASRSSEWRRRLTDMVTGWSLALIMGLPLFPDFNCHIPLYLIFQVHKSLNSWLGGVHIELTGEDVTECLGGAEEIFEHEVDINYNSICDPRLNGLEKILVAQAGSRRIS